MDGKQKKLLSHILMVMAPLLVLLSITIAWFVSSRTVSLSEMSFASQGTGPGAVLHRAETLENRIFTPAGDTAPATLAHDITWGKEELFDDSHITIENMVPGQCEYFLLVSDHLFTPRLTNVELTPGDEADGKPTLAQCLGLYLIPTQIDMTGEPPFVSLNVPIALTRQDVNGTLTDALFQNGADLAALPAIEDENAQNAYILAVYCDPIYGQGTAGAPVHVGTLPGTISFSLAFDKLEEAP